jgi:hypothetical protein
VEITPVKAPRLGPNSLDWSSSSDMPPQYRTISGAGRVGSGSHARAVENARTVNPDIAGLTVSARSGEGPTDWYDWLRREAAAALAGLEEAQATS